MKKILKIMSAICLVAIVGVCLVACDNILQPTKKNSLAQINLQGLYAHKYLGRDDNWRSYLHYFQGETDYEAIVTFYKDHTIKIEPKAGIHTYYSENIVWQDLGDGVIMLIQNVQRYNCSKSFRNTGDEYIKYATIGELFMEIEPEYLLENVDIDDATGVIGIWLELLNA